ncbi:MAG: DUF1822 family protein [Synechococcales bacterium]|nr:DUF1822 family protein [Synechococcales bacterium]
MMVNPLPRPTEPLPDTFDWETPDEDRIELTVAQVSQATALSQTVSHPQQQWQVYLHSLALTVVKEWLAEWATDLVVTDRDCSLLHPPLANLIEAACNLKIGDFRLCLLATGSVVGPSVWVPRAALELPAFIPHYFVLVEVLEDQLQAKIHGYLRGDRLPHHPQSQARLSATDWTVALPLQLFDRNPSGLLMELRCLQPVALAPSPTSASTFLETQLTERLPQLLAPDALWQDILTWPEGAQLLSQPDLLNRLYEAQQAVHQGQDMAEAIATFTSPSPSTLSLSQRAMNAAAWLGDRLDHLAQELAWTLMPAFALEPALRSNEFDAGQWEIQLPAEARGAYQDIRLGTAALRLRLVTWPLMLDQQQPGWALVVVLEAQPETQLPVGIGLQIRDEHQLLVEQRLGEALQDGYLYAQVGGYWHELFWITVILADGTSLTLSPVTFNPDAAVA